MNKEHKDWAREAGKMSQCILNQPLHVVIPPGGFTISCPIHPKGHKIYGTSVTC